MIPACTYRVVDDAEALEHLVPQWQALWSRTEGATPFQHPAWLLPWWSAFGTPHLRVATACQAGQLTGIFPAYILTDAHGPKLLPIGAGTTDYLDALGEGATPMLHALLARAAADGVTRADLVELPPNSPLRHLRPPQGWTAHLSETEPCPVLELGHIPPGIRRKLRMSRHRADRVGGATIEDAGPPGLETLIALHQSRWTADNHPGVLADPAVLHCLRTALPRLHQAGLLRLPILRVAGQIAAAMLILLAPGRLFCYLTGYDTAQSFVSPGTLLLGAVLDQAAAEHRTEAHFLRGREPYKYAWGATDRANATLSLRGVRD